VLDPVKVELKITELLEDFYKRRIATLSKLNLRETLKRKNPYLFRAIGTQQANEIVEALLQAYMSSSDEGIFGNVFFEPLAKFVSGGVVNDAEGIDISIEKNHTYTAIAVKSGTHIFNSTSKKKQEDYFKILENRLRKLRKHFDPVVGYCYGRKGISKVGRPKAWREIAGQAFWQELTGDKDFYLKIIRLMKEKPKNHLPEYKIEWDMAVNRFTRDFIKDFCFGDGRIDWEKIAVLNSGIKKKRTSKKKKSRK